MGYYTRYNMEIYKGKTEIEDVLSFIEKDDNGYYWEDMKYALHYGSEVKWYDCDTDMKKLSTHFPDTVFLLEGEGEDSGDIWKSYYKNGKSQYCKAVLTFDPFDENKLT